MSILIKGMDMPKDCHLCPISHWNKLDEFTGCGLKKRFFSIEEMKTSGRPDFCPLIEIKTHGRLIDADALSNSLPMEYPSVVMAINAAPTIIEAEEGET